MRNLKDLKLRKKTEAKVQAWLNDRYIGGFSKGTYIYCPKCGFATINTFNYMWDDAVVDMVANMKDRGLIKDDKKCHT